MSRERLYEIIEKDHSKENGGRDYASRIYDLYILILVCLSMIPFLTKTLTTRTVFMERVITVLFLIDYVMRWITSDFKPHLKRFAKWQAFLLYPLMPMAIIDMLSLLPGLSTFSFVPFLANMAYLRSVRIMRIARCLRTFKTLRYAKSWQYLYCALMRERKMLATVMLVAVMYIFLSAVVIFSVEQETFDTFFDALYWSTATLTTVGYGDIYPHTDVGHAVAMVSAVFGIAIIAMPSGIITAAFMEEINQARDTEEQEIDERVIKLLEELRTLQREKDTDTHALAVQVELLTEQVQQMQASHEKEAEQLRILSEELKNAGAYDKMNGEKQENV